MEDYFGAFDICFDCKSSGDDYMVDDNGKYVCCCDNCCFSCKKGDN